MYSKPQISARFKFFLQKKKIKNKFLQQQKEKLAQVFRNILPCNNNNEFPSYFLISLKKKLLIVIKQNKMIFYLICVPRMACMLIGFMWSSTTISQVRIGKYMQYSNVEHLFNIMLVGINKINIYYFYFFRAQKVQERKCAK